MHFRFLVKKNRKSKTFEILIYLDEFGPSEAIPISQSAFAQSIKTKTESLRAQELFDNMREIKTYFRNRVKKPLLK
jgi:hypothetical protein